MIDCINGDFVRDEIYADISDVTCDLELMIDKPDIYLREVDANELSRIGLQVDDTLFDRNADIDTLLTAYERTVNGSCELAILCGSSGVGKTTIANQLGKYITSSGGHFISCKFDQMKEVKEFSQVASAFNSYIDDLGTNEIDQARLVASKLHEALGDDVHYLAHVLPSLQHVISQDIPNAKSAKHRFDKEYVNAKQRQLYVFSQLVEVICKCSKQTLVLFVDDVQWADPASVSLIQQVLKTSGSMIDGKQLFFLTCYRDDEMQDDHPFWDCLKSICSFGFTKTHVKLECIDCEAVKQALSRLLYLPPRLVNSLSEIIYRKTKGNPLFITRLLRSLNQDRLLRINLVRRRWEWDETLIQTQMLPDDVAAFFTQQISSLPPDSANALAHLSFFGALVSCEIVEALEQNLALQLAGPLESAIKVGLIDKRLRKYYFPHDRIQEAAYVSIGEPHRSHYHMVFGLSLVDQATRTNDDALLFTAVTQLNIGGPSAVFNVNFFVANAKYNLLVGKRAAFKYFNHGITFLRINHWQEQYELTLELFTLAARCALAINDITSLTNLCNSLTTECLLSKLGVNIPESPNRDATLNELAATRMMLNQIPNEAILSYPMMSEYTKAMAMNFLARLILPVREVRPRLLPLIAMKMISFTVEHGLSHVSSIGFALFGGMVAMQGDLREGYRYTKLALSLDDKFKNSNVTAEVILVSVHIMIYIEPYSVVRAELNKGVQCSLAAGNIFSACIHKSVYHSTLLWKGENLNTLKDEYEKADRFKREHGLSTVFFMIPIYQHYVSKLMDGGGQDDLDKTMKFDESLYANHSRIAINFLEIFASLVFNKYDDMMKYGEKFNFKESGLPPWFLVAAHSFQSFIIGLVYYRIFRKTHEPIWAQKAKEYQTKVESWCEQGSAHTFEHKQYLMKAEEAHSHHNFDNAQVLYNRAILLAKQNGFIFDCALACELAAHFYLKLGNAPSAFKYYTIAYWKYVDWGAAAKYRQMEAFSRQTFNVGFPAEAQDLIEDDNTGVPSVTRKRERL